MIMLQHLRKKNFDIDVYESKAVRVVSRSRVFFRRNSGIVEGHPDLAGNDNMGHSVYLELKAKGKIGTLRPLQYDFLERKIKSGAFAMVTDSIELFELVYKMWYRMWAETEEQRKEKRSLLLDLLNDKLIFRQGICLRKS